MEDSSVNNTPLPNSDEQIIELDDISSQQQPNPYDIIDKMTHNEKLTTEEENFITILANKHYLEFDFSPYMKEFFIIRKNGAHQKMIGFSKSNIARIVNNVIAIMEIEDYIEFDDSSFE